MHGTGGVGSCDRAKQPDYGETTQQQEATSTLRKDSPQATSGRWNTSAHPERAGVTEEQVTARNATAAWGPPPLPGSTKMTRGRVRSGSGCRGA